MWGGRSRERPTQTPHRAIRSRPADVTVAVEVAVVTTPHVVTSRRIARAAGFTVSETESLESDAITPPVLCPSTPAWTRAVATGGAADPHSRSLLSGSI